MGGDADLDSEALSSQGETYTDSAPTILEHTRKRLTASLDIP